tara:strand:+ start:288 stop:530 length:243 start_codon:yes stop_codon:yes gene_type:complete
VEKVEKDVDKCPLISYIGYMKEKKITITSSNITPKQWSAVVLELNLMKQAWKPYAKLEMHTHGLNKIIRLGTRKHDARQD